MQSGRCSRWLLENSMTTMLFRLLTLLVIAQSLIIEPALAAPITPPLSEGIPDVGAILSTDRINPANPPVIVECTCKCITNEQLAPGRFTFCERGGLIPQGSTCEQEYAGKRDFCWKLALPLKKVSCTIVPGSCTSMVVPIGFAETGAQ
jgi:hypothetical protein